MIVLSSQACLKPVLVWLPGLISDKYTLNQKHRMHELNPKNQAIWTSASRGFVPEKNLSAPRKSSIE
jgi:hypothetical protein